MYQGRRHRPGVPHEHREPLRGSALLGDMFLGERQTGGPLAVFPIVAGAAGANAGSGRPLSGRDGRPHSRRNGGPYYITLRQALAEGRAQVTEVDEGGSVQELRVVNKGDARILLLDGEELRGAKQNRVLSTTILVDKHSELVVPVSCIEQGRWAYASPELVVSDDVADRRVRHQMRASTYVALAAGAAPMADQGRVWHEVRKLHSRQGTYSPTGAMSDAYDSKRRDLDEVLAAFPLVNGQQGVLVLHGRRVIGLDYVSRPVQYAELHAKLLRSYAFEALMRGGKSGDRPMADAFLQRVAGLVGRRFKSPGLGWDVRFDGNGVLGSALQYRGCVVHAAFFDVGGVLGEVDADHVGCSRRPTWRIADARQRASQRRQY